MSAFFRIRNWERFQHYKDRTPPWVKLYTSWQDDYEWSQWSDASKLLAVCIVMLAGRANNRLPNDPRWIQKRCSLQKPPDLKPLFASNFIEAIQELPQLEQDASTLLAECTQDASNVLSLARSREERQSRGETEGASAPIAIEGLDTSVFARWLDYRQQIRKPLKPVSVPAAQRELAAYGPDQAAVVEQSIAKGWTGLFPLKGPAKAAGPMLNGKPVEWQ